jgi:alcohol dehydrogenase
MHARPSSPRRLFTAPPWPLQPFDFHTSTRVMSGPGTLQRLGEVARELGATRALLVTDPGLEAAGHPQRAVASLEGAGLAVHCFDDVEENPTSRHVEAGVSFARSLKIDVLVSVGGGSAMDCAKGINFILTNGGRMSDYKGFGKAQRPMLPSIGVPTTAGTGSEAQSYALIADETTHLKMACGDRKAAFCVAILDPEVTVSQPAKVTALTGIDAVSHAVEAYVTSKRSPLSQIFAREAWKLLEINLEKVLQQPDNLEARGAMQMGAFLAGTAIENSMLGVCHACANPLTAHYGLTHGLAIGVMLPHVVRYNAEAASGLYGELLDEAGLPADGRAAPAEALAQHLEHLLRLAQVPLTLGECGVSGGILPLLAEEANQQWTARFNPRAVSEHDILRLYQQAM